MGQKWSIVSLQFCQSLNLCQGPALFTGTEVADKNGSAEHSSKGRMTNTHKVWKWKLLRKKNLEGLREFRVT